jgi:prolyl-tRNA synthetase
MMAVILQDHADQNRLVFAVVRGDMEVNETKLANSIKARSLRPATEDEIAASGAVPGYASPIGVKNALIVVDDLIPAAPNLVAGANEEGYHLQNVNYGRDYQADLVVDLTEAREGDACPRCKNALEIKRGVEVGNIFKLGTYFSEPMGCYYLDELGQSKPVVMGSYGIGVGRLLACTAELHHDDQGLVWPITIAPYHVHLIVLRGKGDAGTLETAERLYTDLQAAGIEVLYDDRQETPGIKFNDADLIGLPVRLTVSERAAKSGGVEYKRRDRSEREVIPHDQVIARVLQEISDLFAQIDEQVEAALRNIELEGEL